MHASFNLVAIFVAVAVVKPAFWWMTAGATVAAFCGYGISSFQSIFLVRMHGITTGEAAIWINAPVSMSSAIGTFATGWLATKLYQKHQNVRNLPQ